jgi:hypothetical protein
MAALQNMTDQQSAIATCTLLVARHANGAGFAAPGADRA